MAFHRLERIEEKSIPEEASRIGQGLGMSALSGLTSTFFGAPEKGLRMLLSKLSGHRYPVMEQVAQEPMWTPNQLLSPEKQQELQPQGGWEEFGQKVAGRALPTAAISLLTGGAASIPASLAGTTAGAAAGTGLEKAGAPDWLSGGADVLTDVLTSGAIAGMQKGLPLRPKTALRRSEEILAKDFPITKLAGAVEAESLEKPLTIMRETARLSKNKVEKEALDGIIESFEEVLSDPRVAQGKADLRHLKDVRRQIDTHYDTLKNSGIYKDTIKPLRDEVNNLLRGEMAQAANPVYWKNLSIKDQLSRAEMAKSSIHEMANKWKPTWKDAFISKKVLAIPKAAVYALLKGTASLADLGKYIVQPQFREIYFNIAASMNASDFERNAEKLIEYFSGSEKKAEAPKFHRLEKIT